MIVSLCFTSFGRAYEFKLEMLEAVKQVSREGKIFNLVDHVANIMKSNYQKCQETV